MSLPEHTQPGSGSDTAADLAGSVRELADRIEALQADVRRLGGPALPTAEPGWDDMEQGTGPSSYAWVGAIEPPVRRRPAVPRLLLEVLFLAAVAVAAGLADLDAAEIAAVMAGAWVLVALIEWASSRADRSRDTFAPMTAPPSPAPVAADPAWFVPPVEHTLLEAPDDSVTAVSKLPSVAEELDATVERSPGA